MAYCTGNCLDWDEVSGNLTIKQDPLGGLECLPDGQRIRIAGNTRNVAANAANNGLFMTVAGELATKVTPTRKNYAVTSNGIDLSTTVGGNQGPFSYSYTPVITYTNPSTVYPMLVFVTVRYHYGFQVRGNGSNGSVSIIPLIVVNGANTPIGQIKDTLSNGTTAHKDTINMFTYNRFDVLAAGGTITYAAYQDWYTINSDQFFYSASTVLEANGIIMPTV